MKLAARALLALLLALCLAVAAAQGDDANETGALPASAADGVVPVVVPNPVPTIYGFVSASESHTILTAIIDSLGNLSATLDEPGTRFTLFAPDDPAMRDVAAAFNNGKVPDDVPSIVKIIADGVASLSSAPGSTDVSGIIFYHVLGAPYTFAELEELRMAQTLQGNKLMFGDDRVRDLDRSRKNARPDPKNVFCQNGWIHSVNVLLLPFDLAEAVDVVISAAADAASPSDPPASTDDPNATEDPTTTADPDAPAPTREPVSVPAVGGATSPTDAPASETDEIETEEASESPEDDDDVCFPATARIHTPTGHIAMRDLAAGHQVLHHEDGAASKVFLFTHRTSAHRGWFTHIETAAGHAVTMTGSHYLYVNDRLTAADAVVLGDVVRTISGKSPVTAVRRVRGVGLYAPHSVHGDLVVDGIVVSGYSRAVRPGIAHAILTPVRWFVRLTGVTEPFGAFFYNGGRGLENWVPKGNARY